MVERRSDQRRRRRVLQQAVHGEQRLEDTGGAVALAQPQPRVVRPVPLEEVVAVRLARRGAPIDDREGDAQHLVRWHLGLSEGCDVGLQEACRVQQPGAARVEVVVLARQRGEKLAHFCDGARRRGRVAASVSGERGDAQHCGQWARRHDTQFCANA